MEYEAHLASRDTSNGLMYCTQQRNYYLAQARPPRFSNPHSPVYEPQCCAVVPVQVSPS